MNAKLIFLFVILSLISKPSFADVSPPLRPVELESVFVNSVFYSKSRRQALLGVVSPKGVGEFLECAVPNGASIESLSLQMLDPCYSIPGTRYVIDDETVKRLAEVFPVMLQASRVAIENERTDEFAQQTLKTRTAVGLGLFAAGGGATALGYKLFKISSPTTRVGTFARYGGALFAVGLGLDLVVRGVRVVFEKDKLEVPALEDKYAEHLKHMVASGNISSQAAMEMAQVDGAYVYESIRRAIIGSVQSTNSL